MTKQPAPIKTDLFRFITVRTPQLINEEKKKLGFIYHPDPSRSYFLEGVHTKNIDVARRIVRQKTDNFKAWANHEKVKSISLPLYNFSQWLSRKRQLVEEDIKLRITEVPTLSPEEQIKVWDNLFYQLLVRDNPYVRQACIQLLIANNFIEVASRTDIQTVAEKIIQTPKTPRPPAKEKRFTLLLRRLALAKIVVPKPFSIKKQGYNGNELTTGFEPSPADLDFKNAHLASKSEVRIDAYHTIKQQLKIGMGAKKDLHELLASPEATNFLAAETLDFIDAYPKKGVHFQMIEAVINDKIREEKNKVERYKPNKKAGQAKDKKPKPYCYVLSIDRMENRTEVYMTMYLGYAGAYLLSADYEISLDNQEAIKGADTQILDTKIQHAIMIRLFPHKNFSIAENKLFRIKGSFTFDNKVTIQIDKEGPLPTNGIHGCGTIFTEDIPSENGYQHGILYGVNRVGIGILRKVEQEVCCYVPGEVSRIENILAREYKERHTRSLVSTEITEEDTTEIEVENQSDTVSTNRNELQTEIANEINKENSIGTGASLGVSGKMFGSEVSADAYFDFATSTSSSASDTAAQTYAQEITNSALERILQKTTQKRTSKILQEYEENNRHGFDNREGTQHVTGVYRWVDIIYTNRLINYGKRLMIEFLIPEPAKFYKRALKQKEKKKSSGTDKAEAPKPPSEYGINSPSDITEGNYQGHGRTYGVTLNAPITPAEKPISKTFGPSDDPNGDADPNAKVRDYEFTMNFMEFGDLSKYSTSKVTLTFNFDYHYTAAEDGTYFILKVENETERYDKDNLAKSEGTSKAKARNKSAVIAYENMDGIKNSISASVEIKNVYNFTIIVKADLVLDEQETINWQNDVYDTLMRAYEDQLAAYEDEVAAEEEAAKPEEETVVSNPDFNRTVEQRELQRITIEMLTKPFGIQMGEGFYYKGECDVPQVEQTAAWEKYASHVKFFEQAIDWPLMAYLFYPYYWADKCNWIKLLQTKDASDPIFEAFLQSGMARMVVPIRKGFEEAFDYYMETGDIWNGGGLVQDSDDDLYLSIDDELLEIEGFVEEEWATRVPTTLTIVQGSSVFLEDEGLPCCENVTGRNVDTKLRGSDIIMGLNTPESSEDSEVVEVQ